MKAVVLVGGEGTRMRPLTETVPKPLLPVMNRPALHHVLDHLAEHGVHEVVLSSPYLEAAFHPFIESRHGDPRITWITETEPLGTGGAIVNAAAEAGVRDPFFALNGDILTDLDLTAMFEFHREHGSEATIALHHVDDARAFGLVPTGPDGRVIEFREKPAEPIPGDINAGTYVLEPRALSGWQAGDEISIERQVFPGLVERGAPMYGFLSVAYWMDLGTPEKYLQAHFDLLEGKLAGHRYEAPLVDETATVDPRAHLGRWVVVGEGASIGSDAEVDDSVLHAGASIEDGARVRGSVLGADSRVSRRATAIDCVLSQGAALPPDALAEGARVSAGDLFDPASASDV